MSQKKQYIHRVSIYSWPSVEKDTGLQQVRIQKRQKTERNRAKQSSTVHSPWSVSTNSPNPNPVIQSNIQIQNRVRLLTVPERDRGDDQGQVKKQVHKAQGQVQEWRSLRGIGSRRSGRGGGLAIKGYKGEYTGETDDADD